MIQRSKLHPHPDNPRKDLGDLEELRESIKEHGIMQNLTVVPEDDNFENFRILIGHRRYAASEGILYELPCVIVEGLSDREQVGIMLCENMQRADLTVFEQAHGFQLMLDLGDTVETISEKTGFSEATVKHRLEINKLKKSSINTAQEYFQLSIGDFIELEKIKDVKQRNKILEEVDSSTELKDEVRRYCEEQIREANVKKYLALFKSLGWNESKEYFYGDKWNDIKGMTKIDLSEPYNDETIKASSTRISEPIYYRFSGNWFVEFAIKKPVDKKEKKKTKEERLAEARQKQATVIDGARIEICDLYYKFIIQIPEKRISALTDKDCKNLMSKLFELLISLEGSMNGFKHYYNIKTHADIKNLTEDFQSFDILQKMMILIWSELSSSYQNKLTEWNFTKNMRVLEAHQTLYAVLTVFGFKLDDNYKSIIEGKSDIFNVKI